MRQVPGRLVLVNGRTVYVEQSGRGDHWVVFEAGGGCGRTCWDPVLPLLADTTRLVTYDRAGRARSGAIEKQLSIDEMADDLVAMTEAVIPGDFVLVAHSMGGLIARRAAERLDTRLRGLLLIDPTPETSPVYDNWEKTVTRTDHMLAVTQALTHFRFLAGLFVGNLRRWYPAETYRAMLTEDLTPAGIAQTRTEVRAVSDAVPAFRLQPPRLPECPVIVLSAGRPEKGRAHQNALAQAHDRRFADSLPDGRYENVDSAHLIQAEQPQLIATKIRQLLEAARGSNQAVPDGPGGGRSSLPLASAQPLVEPVSMSKTVNAPRAVIAFVGLVHIPLTVLTWLDLRSRPAAQIRGSKVIWRLASALNTTGSVAYWVFGRRRSVAEPAIIG